MLLDNLATRYHLLPSEVLQRGDTLDVMVMEASQQWTRLQQERAEAKRNGKAAPSPKLSVSQMKAMMAAARSGK